MMTGQKNDTGSSHGEWKARLMRKARLVDALTFLAVITVSPASVLLSYAFGVVPQVWVEVWLRYVVFFIILAIVVAIVGLGFSNHYWLKANAR